MIKNEHKHKWIKSGECTWEDPKTKNEKTYIIEECSHEDCDETREMLKE